MMRKSQESLEWLEAALRLANPVPYPSALADSTRSLAVSRLVSRRRHAMRPNHTAPPEARHRWRGPAIAAAAFAAALAIALPLLFLRGGDESFTVATEGTTTITTTATTAPAAMPGIVAASISLEDTSWPYRPLVALSAGEVWTVMRTDTDAVADLVGHLKDGAWTFWRLTGTDGPFIKGLAVAPNGTVWAATLVGVFSFDGEEWTRRFDEDAGGVTVGGDGTVWIGGWGESSGVWLARWDGESWERVTSPVGPGGTEWADMAVLPGGDVWATTGSYCMTSRLMHYDGATLAAVQVGGREFLRSYVSAIEAAPNGDLWVAGFLGGEPGFPVNDVQTWTEPVVLARFDGEAWTLYDWPLPNPIADCTVPLLDMAVGPDGALWLAYPGGFGSFDGTQGTPYFAGDPAPLPYLSVDVAPDGTVWYTDSEGVHTLSTP